jgi:membrane protein DedA with SNARE-associated domain
MLKQIACIAAYATGFAVGTYATCKAVKAIELRWPMKSNPLECDITLFKKHGGKSTATFTFLDGSKFSFEGTKDEIEAKIKQYGFQPL